MTKHALAGSKILTYAVLPSAAVDGELMTDETALVWIILSKNFIHG
jgi:hypothetical protein